MPVSDAQRQYLREHGARVWIVSSALHNASHQVSSTLKSRLGNANEDCYPQERTRVAENLGLTYVLCYVCHCSFCWFGWICLRGRPVFMSLQET